MRWSPIRRFSSFYYKSGLTDVTAQLQEVCLDEQSKVHEFIACNRAGFGRTILHRLFSSFSSYSDFDVNGILNIYPLHLFTEAQLKVLMQRAKVDMIENALDIGSGCGDLTAALSGICRQKLITTETSHVMCQKLRDKGYECWREDVSTTYRQHIAKGHTFNLVSMLNVIDRTPKPNSLLLAAHSMLNKNGLLLLATPLPFRPFYFTNDFKFHNTRRKYGQPLETIPGLSKIGLWDEQAEILLKKVLPENGFEPVVFARLPYVSGGDYFTNYTALDDILVVSRKVELQQLVKK